MSRRLSATAPMCPVVCDGCGHATDLIHCKATNEHLCEDCIMALAIAYYEARRTADDELVFVTDELET